MTANAWLAKIWSSCTIVDVPNVRRSSRGVRPAILKELALNARMGYTCSTKRASGTAPGDTMKLPSLLLTAASALKSVGNALP